MWGDSWVVVVGGGAKSVAAAIAKAEIWRGPSAVFVIRRSAVDVVGLW
jgi:hypothetical protein